MWQKQRKDRKHHVKKQRKDRKWQDMKNLIENTSGQEKENENWRILGDKSWHDRKKKYKYARWQHNKKWNKKTLQDCNRNIILKTTSCYCNMCCTAGRKRKYDNYNVTLYRRRKEKYTWPLQCRVYNRKGLINWESGGKEWSFNTVRKLNWWRYYLALCD